MAILTVEDFLKNYKNYFVSVEKDGLFKIIEPNYYEPEYSEKYWHVGESADICEKSWMGKVSDFNKLHIGNVFKTKEEAMNERNKLVAMNILKKYGAREFIKGKMNFTLSYDYNNNALTYQLTKCNTCSAGTLYFDSIDQTKIAGKMLEQSGYLKDLFHD